MDLSRHLRHFLVVAEELHFGRAAEALGIAQPPLSQSIQRLERELGVTLFDRTRRQVELTTAGQLLVDEARALLGAEARLRTVMRKARDGALGTLRAGVPPDLPAPVLQAVLHRLSETSPGLSVDLQELTTADQVRQLAAAELDAGLVYHPVDSADLRLGPVVEVPLGVVVSRLSPLARLSEVDLADLSGHDLVVFPRTTAPDWYDHLLRICREHGFQPSRLRHGRNAEFVLGLVLAGHGVAFEPEAVARREPRVAWRPLAGRPLARRLSGVWPARGAHPAAARFAEVARDVLGAAHPPGRPLATPDGPGPWAVVFEPQSDAALG